KGTYEDYVGKAGLDRRGKKKWRREVADVVDRLIAALEPEDTVLGGGNVRKLKTLPPHTRAGDNDNAFRGGFRLWKKDAALPRAGSRPPALARGVRRWLPLGSYGGRSRPANRPGGGRSKIARALGGTATCGHSSPTIPRALNG